MKTTRRTFRGSLRRYLRRRAYRFLLLGILGLIALWRTVNAPATVAVSPAVQLPRTMGAGLLLVHARWEMRPVKEVFEDLSRQTGLPFYMDWPAFRREGIEPDTQVAFVSQGPGERVTVAEAVSRMGVGAAVDFNSRPVYVSTIAGIKDTKRLVRVVYPIEDLVQRDSPWSYREETTSNPRDTLMHLVKEVIDPTMWEEMGGIATVERHESRLIVDATPGMHTEIRRFFAALRTR